MTKNAGQAPKKASLAEDLKKLKKLRLFLKAKKAKEKEKAKEKAKEKEKLLAQLTRARRC